MACRVGIATNPERRKKEWKNEYPSLRNWKVVKTFESKSDAQAFETRLASDRRCVSSAGGDGKEHAAWSVYYFEF